MAFALPRISRGKPKATKPAKPAYSPQTEKEITEAMFNLALSGPRWIGEQLGRDLDEAFEIGDTGVSLKQLVFHPLKTFKKTLRKWTVSRWAAALGAQLAAEYVWKPRLGHFVAQKSITDAERDAILDWVSKPPGRGKDLAFERLERLYAQGKISDDVWEGIKRQHSWDEFARFRRRPGRYLWQKFFGKRGTKEAPFYKHTPQKWLGEPLGKALAKTSLGRAVAGAKQAVGRMAQGAVAGTKKALKAAAKVVAEGVKKGARWVITKVAGQATWASISAAVGGAVGSLGGPIGTVIGFLAGPAVSKLLEWFLKIACLGCGCAAVIFISLVSFIVVLVGSAFRPGETGGPGQQGLLVRVEKTADPHHLGLVPAGSPNPVVRFTIHFENLTEEDAAEVRLVDDFDEENFTPSALGGGRIENGTLVWDLPDLRAGASGSVSYDGFVKANDGVDKVVVNNAELTVTLGGQRQTFSASGFVTVGNPSGQLPSGWPVSEGCLTQGPYTSDSHRGLEAIDIAPRVAGTSGQPIYATHDGIAYVYYNGTGSYTALGNYVVIESPRGFRSYYGHLLSISVQSGQAVFPGQQIGTMGNSGRSSGVHLHYEFRGLPMAPPYIPVTVGPCVGRDECNYCF